MLTERLVQLREERKLTKKQMAEFLKINQSTYGKYELGKREPDIEKIIELADYFNVSTDYLLGRSDIRNHQVPKAQNKGLYPLDTSGLAEEDIAYIDALIAGIKIKK